MGYALQNDFQGWRIVDSPNDCFQNETYGENQPINSYRKFDAVFCMVFDLGNEFTNLVPGKNQAWDDQRGIWARGTKATLAELSDKKQSVLDAGYVSNGHSYQIRDIDISNLQSVMLAFALEQTNPHGGSWRDSANVNVTLTDTQMRALALAAITYHRDVFRAWSAHKDAIVALVATANAAHPGDAVQAQYAATEAAELYDINANWPENGA